MAHTSTLSPRVDPSLVGDGIKDNPNLFDSYHHHHHQELLTHSTHCVSGSVNLQSGAITGTTDKI